MQRLFLFTLLFLSFVGTRARAQEMAEVDRTLPEFSFSQQVLAGEMHFLASDFLAGRRTGSLGNEIASEYIAAQLRAAGAKPINGESYFQTVPLMAVSAPAAASVTVGERTFTHGGDLLVMRGPAVDVTTEVVFANYGWVDEETDHNDYEKLKVKGKIVVTRAGIPGDVSQRGVFRGMREKAKMAADAGAVAIYEIYSLPFPWSAFKGYLGGERIQLDRGTESSPIPYGFLNAGDALVEELQAKKKKGQKGGTNSTGMTVSRMESANVGGILAGTDPALANEYMIVTAHFDHVGVGAQGGGAYTEQDSIFNGARDNAFGTISLLATLRAFAEQPTKRPVIFLAVTGEELGLLGSQYYAENPLVPLEQTIFNFNTDGAGYNATDAVSLIGSNRTGIDPQVQAAAKAFGMRVINDPAPEQGLFDRSDNVSFAAKGVPALSFSPGMTDFNEEVMRYYHQVGDNPETIDMEYLTNYCKVFSLAARMIANRDTVPFWKEDDKYREAGDKLYNKK